MRGRFLSLGAVLLFTFGPLLGDDGEEASSRLTLERIYESNEFQAEGFSGRWLPKGGYATLETAAGGPGGRDLVRHDPETGATAVLVPATDLIPRGEARPLDIADWSLSNDEAILLISTNTKRVWRYETRGDYWTLDRSSRELRKLGGPDAPASSLQFAKLSPDGRQVAYVRANDLWVEDLRNGTVARLTEGGSEDVAHGTGDWVYEEELDVRDGFRWSPDGRTIAFWEVDSTGVPRFPLVDWNAGLYPSIRWFHYPKVGEQNPSARAGLVDVADPSQLRWVDLPGDPRAHYIARMEFTPAGEILIQQLDRLQQTNRVFVVDPATGDARVVYIDQDPCWVNVADDVFWHDGGKRFTFASERGGWRQIYSVALDGGDARLLTTGEFDAVELLRIDDTVRRLWFIASPRDPTRRALWTAPLDGDGSAERVTPRDESGTHSYDISPDGRYAFHTISSFADPPRVDLIRLPSHETVRTLVTNDELREKLERLDRSAPEFIRVAIDGDEPAASNALLDAWVLEPPGIDREKKHPVIVYVYGEPAGQTVVDRFSTNGYLWHLLLAQRGWVVVSFDNRGTPAPRGREWRKSVYRRVGILGPEDQAKAILRLLEERSWLDPARVGIWGWSGGGSSSLHAIFRYPKIYRAAISIAPVPNQRLYDTIYQERYMGLPHDNVDGFLQGSPITHAAGLEGDLLLVHGTGDDNCHYQGSVALVDELIRHGKQFTFLPYPNRTHAVREGAGTTPHLRRAMLEFFERTVPPGSE